MSSASLKTLETVRTYFMSPKEELDRANLSPATQERLFRLREYYTLWIQNPRWSDREVARQIRERYHIGTTQSQNDVALLKHFLGEMNRHSRDYDRYVFRQRCEEGWEWARREGDLKAFAAITASYVKGCQLDKDDAFRPDYSLIVPQSFTVTANASAAGFQVAPGTMECARKLYARYAQEAEVVEEGEEE